MNNQKLFSLGRFVLFILCFVFTATAYSQVNLPIISITSFYRSNDNVKYDPTEIQDNVYDYSISALYPYKFDNVTLGQALYLYKDNIYDDNKELEYTMQQVTYRVFKIVKKDIVKVEVGYKDFGRKYYNAPYLNITVNKRLLNKISGIINLTLENREYPNNTFLNGSNTEAEILLKRNNTSANYALAGNTTRGGKYEYQSHTIGIKYNIPIIKKLKFNIGYDFRYRDFTDARIDKRHSASVDLYYPVSKLIGLNINYLYLNNDSNNNDKDYKNNIFSIGLNLKELRF